MKITINKTKAPKQKPDQDNLGFGRIFTDHMFIMDYDPENGWHNPRIEPYAPLVLDPSCMMFHYGQAIFEGLKAYKNKNGDIMMFRPLKNMQRINVSNDRLCIPSIDTEFAVEAAKTLVKVDADWIPTKEGTSLYVRPFIISTDPYLGVRPSNTYKFLIILSPVGAYYPEGLNPVKIFVESNYVRAVRGGVGFAKTPANYAASLKAQMDAKEKGYTQVLWLDGVEKKYIEEVGTMNVFFVIGDTIVTPELNGSILAGITRDSVIELLKSWDLKVEERKISIKEVYDAHKAGILSEAFGTGTAAVISPIGGLDWEDNEIELTGGKIGELSAKLYDAITGIQGGKYEDKFNWITKVD